MYLNVPQKTDADASSFPVDPDGVNRWLGKLNPDSSVNDAMEVYRGLRHSNRLNNDLNRRRAVIACFIPTLRDLCNTLQEICQAQPLPLTSEFQRSAQLLDGLLREEALAFKILLAESPQPRGNDLRRAMQALSRQAACRVLRFRTPTEPLLNDAHQLYALAEEFSLLDAKPEGEQYSSYDHYRFILLLTLADCRQHRVGQLQPLLDFLRVHAPSVRLTKQMPADPSRVGTYAFHLGEGAKPIPATALMVEGKRDIRWFNVAPLLTRIDAQLANINSQHTALLGSETLDRQSFARLRVTFARSRIRRAQRRIAFEEKLVTIGHKSICAHMHLAAAKAASSAAELSSAHLAEGYEAMNKVSGIPILNNDENWILTNQSSQGACLSNKNCRAGTVQVGELISVQTPDDVHTTSASGRSQALLGIIRWVTAHDTNGITLGMEFLAKGVLPVGLSRSNSADIVADDALIVACKVQNKILQTILLPAYLYQKNDRLIVTLNGKSRHVILSQQLQHNGLFSHFALKDA